MNTRLYLDTFFAQLS